MRAGCSRKSWSPIGARSPFGPSARRTNSARAPSPFSRTRTGIRCIGSRPTRRTRSANAAIRCVRTSTFRRSSGWRRSAARTRFIRDTDSCLRIPNWLRPPQPPASLSSGRARRCWRWPGTRWPPSRTPPRQASRCCGPLRRPRTSTNCSPVPTRSASRSSPRRSPAAAGGGCAGSSRRQSCAVRSRRPCGRRTARSAIRRCSSSRRCCGHAMSRCRSSPMRPARSSTCSSGTVRCSGAIRR